MLDDPTEDERLDNAIDAALRGERSTAFDGVNTGLLAAFMQVRALADEEPVDLRLKRDLWREMMNVTPTANKHDTNPGLNGRPPLLLEPARGRSIRNPSRPRRGVGETLTTLTLIALLLIGFIGYRQFGGEEDTGPIRLPAANQASTPTAPTASGCVTPPREPGSVAALAGTPPARGATLPRVNNDPVYSEALGSNDPVDGEVLLLSSEPDTAHTAAVTNVLEQLVACRIYVNSNPSTTDLDGRYWALYSDDYFRRELSGYREAGLPIDLGTFWLPSTIPAVIETRVLKGDSRVLAILERPTPDNPNRVVIFDQSGDDWVVDEVGMARMPSDNPIYAVAPEVASGRLPQLDIVLYETGQPVTPPVAGPASPEPAETICDQLLDGPAVPCGVSIQRFGPYLFNEFPADTDFTITLYNLGDEARRFTITNLGIDATVAPDEAVSFVLNARAGEYIYFVYEGTDFGPIDSGVFTFIAANEQPSVG